MENSKLSFICKRQCIAVIVFVLLVGSAWGQNTILSPSGDGGFENGNTFAANGWNTVVYSSDLTVSSLENNVSSGSNGCFYTGIADGSTRRYSHLYRDFTVKAEKYYTINLKYRTSDVVNTDEWFGVYIADVNQTPITSNTTGTLVTSINTTQTSFQFFGETSVIYRVHDTDISKRIILTFSKISTLSHKSIAIDEIEIKEYDFFPYYSTGNGSPSTLSSWNSSENGSGISPLSFSAGNRYIIQTEHILTTNQAWNATTNSILEIQPGGTLQVNASNRVDIGSLIVYGTEFNPGIVKSAAAIYTSSTIFNAYSKYIHNYTTSGGTIPASFWHETSTCEIVGYTTNTNAPNGLNNQFGNFIWNCPNQTGNIIAGGNLTSVKGDFRILSTGFATFVLTNNNSHQLVLLGDFDITGGSLVLSSGSGNSKILLHGNFSQSGGTITESGTASGEFVFNGSTEQLFHRTNGSISNLIHFTVKDSSILNMETSVLNGSTGTFTLESGATLITAHPDGFSSTGTNSGSIQVSGTRTYSEGASYHYNGSSAQVTGSGLPGSVMHLTIDNSHLSGLSLSNNLTVLGTLTYKNGTINLNGKTLTAANQVAEITTEYPTSLPSVLSTLTINNAGGVTLPNDLSCASLIISNGLLYLTQDLSHRTLSVSDSKISIVGGSISSLSMTNTSNSYPPKGKGTSIARTWTLNGESIQHLVFDVSTEADPLVSGVVSVWKRLSGSLGEWSKVGESYQVLNNKVTVSLASKSGKANEDWTICREDQTLPVELSGFTAVLSAQGMVQLIWITQSETEMLGFYLYRSMDPDINLAERISSLIHASNTSITQSYIYTDSELTQAGLYYYWLQSVDIDGSEVFSHPISFVYSGEMDSALPPIPIRSGIQALYPNPFNPQLTICYAIPHASSISLTIYNVRGQKVKSLFAGQKEAGIYTLTWDGKDEAGFSSGSGTYLICLICAGERTIAKALLLK